MISLITFLFSQQLFYCPGNGLYFIAGAGIDSSNYTQTEYYQAHCIPQLGAPPLPPTSLEATP